MSGGITYMGHNVWRDKTLRRTEHPVGQNVQKTKRPVGHNVWRDKTSRDIRIKKHPDRDKMSGDNTSFWLIFKIYILKTSKTIH
jgi:hypothetical protein